MFNQYSRTQLIKNKGIYFYEQDVIYDDYVYQGDMVIDIALDYYHNGFGLVLFPQPGLKTENQKTNYLFKISGQEISVYLRNNETLKKVKSNSILIPAPISNLKLKFSKIGRIITVHYKDQKILSYQLPTAIYKQSIGYYSNKGNFIKSISIASKVPKNWAVNMSNTLGGRLSFEKDAFKLEACVNNAEIIQDSISLEAGVYYLQYNASEDCDIIPNIILANDDQLFDKDKNILVNNTFLLNTNSDIILKFVGKHGAISRIQISKVNNTKYVPTTDEQYIFSGSEITIATKELFLVDLDFEITNKSYDGFASHLFSNLIESYSIEDLMLSQHLKYHLNYNCLSRVCTIYSEDKKVIDKFFENVSTVISLFKNIEADITHFIITYKDGKIKDITSNLNNIETIENTLLSPIIVVNETEEPMDLSSSYRQIETDNQTIYLFTNTERETFDTDESFYLSNEVSEKPGAVKVYGIPIYASCNLENLYKGTKQNIHNLSAYCNEYVAINSQKFSVINNSVVIDYVELQKYKKIIIDYEKANSYCINFNYALQVYEVEITEDNYKILYDKNSYKTKSSFSSQKEDKFRYTSIKPLNKQYIVLRKESE